jgi:hypothetical protein
MSYLGQSPGQGKAERFIFTASGGETSVTLDDAGRGVAYTVGQVDVYLNGVKLVNGTDFTATSGSSITGLSALSASDVVEIVALDAFSPADTVSASNGGTFSGNVTHSGNLTSTGTTALQNVSTTNSALNISSSASDGSATIDASGNLLVGKTSSGTQNTTDGFELRQAGYLFVTKTSDTVAYFNRRTTDGNIVEFRKDGTTVGSIGVEGTDLLISNPVNGGATILVGEDTGGTETRLAMHSSTGSEAFRPFNSYSDAKFDLGASSRRFKNLYLSGGVYLGGTGSANYLDDYETGTFTPTATPSSGSFTTTSNTGTYRKVGSMVYVHMSIGIANVGTGSGYINLGGLPFAFATTGGSGQVPLIVRETNLIGDMFGGFLGNTATDGRIHGFASSTTTVNPQTGDRFNISACYITS